MSFTAGKVLYFLHNFGCMKAYSLTFCLFACCFFSTLMGQSSFDRRYGAKVKAYHMIKNLKDSGTVLILLPLHRNEIASLQRKLAAPNLAEKDRVRIVAAIATINEDVQNTIVTTREVFKSVYSFSEIAFAWDTCATALKYGQRNNIVLDQNLKQTIPYFNSKKFTAVVQYSAADRAWFIVDTELKEIGAPFPYRMNIAKRGFNDGGVGIAIDLQQLLTQFYNEALIRLPKIEYLRQKKELKAKLKALGR
jgi:hypothetical protein